MKGGKIYVLRAATVGARKEWMDAITELISASGETFNQMGDNGGEEEEEDAEPEKTGLTQMLSSLRQSRAVIVLTAACLVFSVEPEEELAEEQRIKEEKRAERKANMAAKRAEAKAKAEARAAESAGVDENGDEV